MSKVYNVIVGYSSGEDNDWIGNINDWLTAHGHLNFVRLDSRGVGGEKSWEGHAFVGAFNSLDGVAFLEFVFRLEYVLPEFVWVLVTLEGGEYAHLFKQADWQKQLWTFR